MLFKNAPCHGATDVFLSDNAPRVDQAKEICGTCRYRSPCLDTGLDVMLSSEISATGIFGGEYFHLNQIVRRRRMNSGALPKNRPDVYVRDLPLPVALLPHVKLRHQKAGMLHLVKTAEKLSDVLGLELGPIVMPDGQIESTFTKEMLVYFDEKPAA